MTVLNIRTAVTLAELISACQRNAPVTWTKDGGATIMSGTARAICHSPDGRTPGGFLSGSDDVRDGYVWISATFEHVMKVSDVLQMMRDQTFVCDYRP